MEPVDGEAVTLTDRLDRLPLGVFHVVLIVTVLVAPAFVFGLPLLVAALVTSVAGVETRGRRLEEISVDASPAPAVKGTITAASAATDENATSQRWTSPLLARSDTFVRVSSTNEAESSRRWPPSVPKGD